MNKIEEDIIESIAVKKLIIEDVELIKGINNLVDSCINSLQSGGKVIFCGNGGSFGDAQHLSAEFTSRFRFNRPALSSVVLGTNSSAMSAIGNDYGFERVFSRELEAIGSEKDIFIPITTSGNSKNILLAVNYASLNNIKTYALTGRTGGDLKELCECICIPSEKTERIQESHIMVGHIICRLVEEKSFPLEAEKHNKKF